jgi:hypothetical protein
MAHSAWPSLDATVTEACGNSFSDVLATRCSYSRRSSKSQCSALSACHLRFWLGTLATRFVIMPAVRSAR